MNTVDVKRLAVACQLVFYETLHNKPQRTSNHYHFGTFDSVPTPKRLQIGSVSPYQSVCISFLCFPIYFIVFVIFPLTSLFRRGNFLPARNAMADTSSDLDETPSIECFQNYTAPEVFIQGIAGIVNQEDVESMIIAQKEMQVFAIRSSNVNH